MQGIEDPPAQRGIIPRAFEHIFEAISLSNDIKYLVLASYLEIYNEEIRDLLGYDCKKKLDLKESADRGVYVSGKENILYFSYLYIHHYSMLSQIYFVTYVTYVYSYQSFYFHILR